MRTFSAAPSLLMLALLFLAGGLHAQAGSTPAPAPGAGKPAATPDAKQEPKPAPKPDAAQDPKTQDPKPGAKPADKPADKPTDKPGAKAAAAPSSTFSSDQLEQIAAPIALYPDSLLAQVLMASTYPLEVVEAARWLASKGGKLQGKELESALQSQTWEPSVKSLCGFPTVLKRLDENLDWTQDLGDAFLGQKDELMTTVQTLRQKALESGNLKSSKEQKVTETEKIIVIESTNPEVVYVPTYYPTAVYGGWAYPTYYYPPMYVYPPGALAFSFAVGVAWGACWGSCHWGHSHCDVDIDVNNYNKFVDRTERPEQRPAARDKAAQNKARGEGWQHDATHRKGASYRDSKVASKYGGTAGNNRVSRDQARGYDRASQRPATGSGAARPSTGAANRPSAGTANRPATTKPGTAKTGTAKTGKSSGSLTGAGSAKTERAASQRGSTSRGSSGSRGASRSSGGGGASRGGGGGGRGGGGGGRR